MTAETITIPMPNGQVLIFRPLDDAAAMRLIRVFFQVAMASATADDHIAFLEQLAAPLVTPHNPATVAQLRQSFSADHPNQRLSDAAWWLAVQLGKDVATIPRTVAVLAQLPPEMLRQMAAAARAVPAVKVPRGKPRP